MECLPLENETRKLSQNVWLQPPVMQCYIPEELKSPMHCCNSLKTCTVQQNWRNEFHTKYKNFSNLTGIYYTQILQYHCFIFHLQPSPSNFWTQILICNFHNFYSHINGLFDDAVSASNYAAPSNDYWMTVNNKLVWM